jgi:hypothetical protein
VPSVAYKKGGVACALVLLGLIRCPKVLKNRRFDSTVAGFKILLVDIFEFLLRKKRLVEL